MDIAWTVACPVWLLVYWRKKLWSTNKVFQLLYGGLLNSTHMNPRYHIWEELQRGCSSNSCVHISSRFSRGVWRPWSRTCSTCRDASSKTRNSCRRIFRRISSGSRSVRRISRIGSDLQRLNWPIGWRLGHSGTSKSGNTETFCRNWRTGSNRRGARSRPRSSLSLRRPLILTSTYLR